MDYPILMKLSSMKKQYKKLSQRTFLLDGILIIFKSYAYFVNDTGALLCQYVNVQYYMQKLFKISSTHNFPFLPPVHKICCIMENREENK